MFKVVDGGWSKTKSDGGGKKKWQTLKTGLGYIPFDSPGLTRLFMLHLNQTEKLYLALTSAVMLSGAIESVGDKMFCW